MSVKFNHMLPVGNEAAYLNEVLASGKWSGRGPKTLALEDLVKHKLQVKHAFFVTSCTSALEASCLLAGIGPGDEVIMPSFGFVSAANAVVLRGGKPVFADIDPQTWNISLETVESLVSTRTKAILPVHYAGSSAGIEDLREFCRTKKLFLIEDAAQSMGSLRGGKPVGATPWTICFSLHDTKNVSSGEGGLLVTDDAELAARTEIIIEKGTDRQKFLRGQVDKYTWVSMGSSFVASDLLAAVGLAQIENLDKITNRRQSIEKKYREALSKLEKQGVLSFQKLPAGIVTNSHLVGFIVEPGKRQNIISKLREKGIEALFHYVPLHDSPFAKSHGFSPARDLPNTRKLSEGLIRLPIWYGMTDSQIDEVVERISSPNLYL